MRTPINRSQARQKHIKNFFLFSSFSNILKIFYKELLQKFFIKIDFAPLNS